MTVVHWRLVEITWLGHACFRLRAREVSVITDPYSDNGWGYPPLAATADVVTVSHEHPHHAAVSAVAGSPRVLRRPGEYETRGAILWGVNTFRVAPADASPGDQNTAFVVQIEDVTICHLGDLGHKLSAEQLTRIKDCDVLLVPVGGHCTIGATEAAEVIAQIEPKLIVPMHYATPQSQGAVTLEGIERFCHEMGCSDIVPVARLSVTSGNIPTHPEVVVLEARR